MSTRNLRFFAFVCPLVLLFLLGACKSKTITTHEYMYVSAPETSLRDKVATMYGKVGTVHNGERVEVLEKQKRFLRVRTDSGQEGWIEQRSLVPQDVYDGFEKLAQDNKNTPAQALGTTRAELNMHLTPARDGERLYQLKEGEKLEILKRTTTDKNAPKPPKPVPASASTSQKPGDQKTTDQKQSQQPAAKPADANKPAPATPAASTPGPAPNATNTPASASSAKPSTATTAAKPATPPEPPKPAWEDWYLVRSQSGHVGWVLLRMVDLDVPLDIAQYAEGQRIIAYFVLNTVDETIDDQPKQIPQYLVLLNTPKDGLPWDFNQFRVFTRNRAKHRYETAYRQRELEGYLPAQVGHQVFDKEGDLPTFTIKTKNQDGQMVENTYKLNGPIVRRVLSPEEEAAAKAKHDADLAARLQARANAKTKAAAKSGAKQTSSSSHHKHKKH